MRKTKLSVKLYILTFTSIVIAAAVATIVMYVGNVQIIDGILSAQTTNTMNTLLNKVDEMKNSSLAVAKHMSSSEDVISAVQNNDKEALIDAANNVLIELLASTDFVTISDADGNVIARTHSEKSGDSVINQQNIREALQGKTASYLEQGTEVKLSMRSSSPIKNALGQIVGVISTGYRFDTAGFVDSLKASTGSEITVFLHDERISTTITQDGERLIGTKLRDDIAQIVIGEKKSYNSEAEILGQKYYTSYEPILDASGDSLGAFFAGIYIGEIKDMEVRSYIITLLVIIPLGVLIIVGSGLFINRTIVAPLKKMSEMSEKLAVGDLSMEEIKYKSNDEIGTLIRAYGSVIDGINLQSEELSLMASGDYSHEIQVRSDQDTMNSAINKLISSTNQMIVEIQTAATEVRNEAQQISSGAQLLAENASNQQSYCTSANTMMVDSMEKTDQMVTAMNDISESADNIKKITQLIHNISSQTNILAINSGIEAARAGETGKSFAVIADQIRTLAAQSADAASRTEKLIRESLSRINSGNEIVKALSEILQSVKIEVNRVAESVENTASQAQQSAAYSEEMSSQANMLTEIISRIRL